MARDLGNDGGSSTQMSIPTFATSYINTASLQVPQAHSPIATSTAGDIQWEISHGSASTSPQPTWQDRDYFRISELGSTGRGILIGMLSAFGSAALVAIVIAIIYFFRYTNRGRILLDRIGRPGEYDDEQQFLRDEEDALADMDDLQRAEYLRAKAFVQANPPESTHTDISLSQFLAIQEKGVSAWEFEPELEIANCFVEARTEIEFFDSECSVQSNLPLPRQNEVYYWEAKLYDKPETTTVSIGLTTKPYPLFRLPGLHRTSLAYTSSGQRRYNQPFTGTNYGPPMQHGDVIGVGWRPRTGTIFFTRNGKKLEDVAHGWKSQNFFPTVGANGPCNIHVNFGQMGFVFIEANVKKWGLAPMTGSLAPPPPYGSEQGSILLEGGREGVREGQGYMGGHGHGRSSSAQIRLGRGPTTISPGPQRSPTDISLAQLNLMDLNEEPDDQDFGEGTSGAASSQHRQHPNSNQESEQQSLSRPSQQQQSQQPDPSPPPQSHELVNPGLPFEPQEHPPPEYESPEEDEEAELNNTPRATSQVSLSQENLLPSRQDSLPSPPIPSYEAATSEVDLTNSSDRGRRDSR